MSRRAGLIEDAISFAARLPWWKSLVLAGVLYATLHVIASRIPAHPTSTAELGSFVVRQAIWTGAAILQYVVPRRVRRLAANFCAQVENFLSVRTSIVNSTTSAPKHNQRSDTGRFS